MDTRHSTIVGTADNIIKLHRAIKKPVDDIVGDVLAELGLKDAPYRFRIVLLDDAISVQKQYAIEYNVKKLNSHSYTSRKDNACYISVGDVSARVLAHEITHAALNAHYTTDKITQQLHELIAQKVEEKVCKRHSRWFW